MTFAELVNSYASDDCKKYINTFFVNLDNIAFSERFAKYIISDVEDDDVFLANFHELYENIKSNNVILNDDIYLGFELIDKYYYDLLDRYKSLEKLSENQSILSEEQSNIKLKERIDALKNPMIYLKTPDFTKTVYNERDKFSLREIFDEEKSLHYLIYMNGSSVITPSQTLSRFNDKSGPNGLEGSGNHENNISEMERAIYGDIEEIKNDICVRYINTIAINGPLMLMTIDIPIPINSSQKKSLEFLNFEIKKLSKEKGILININASMNYYEKDIYGAKIFEDENDLDNILNEIIVNDDYIPLANEVYLVGYPNNENHYNTSNYHIDIPKVKESNTVKSDIWNDSFFDGIFDSSDDSWFDFDDESNSFVDDDINNMPNVHR